MQGRDRFSHQDAAQIRQLLDRKVRADPSAQKGLRARLRRLRFYNSDWTSDQRGFTSRDFEELVSTGRVSVEAVSSAQRSYVDAQITDLMPDPKVRNNHREHVPSLLDRCRLLAPQAIILIKAPVYDAAYQPLLDADLPVIDARVPCPGSGQQRKFMAAFRAALEDAELRSRKPHRRRS